MASHKSSVCIEKYVLVILMNFFNLFEKYLFHSPFKKQLLLMKRIFFKSEEKFQEKECRKCFWESIPPQYFTSQFFANNIQSQTVNSEKLRITLSCNKAVRKMLMVLTPSALQCHLKNSKAPIYNKILDRSNNKFNNEQRFNFDISSFLEMAVTLKWCQILKRTFTQIKL